MIASLRKGFAGLAAVINLIIGLLFFAAVSVVVATVSYYAVNIYIYLLDRFGWPAIVALVTFAGLIGLSIFGAIQEMGERKK